MRLISRSKAERRLKQSLARDTRYTVADFNREFPNDRACLEYIKEQRWPKGVTKCEKCNVQRKHYRVTGRAAYACDHCGNHIYPLKGTVFARSTTSLKTWFYVMYLMASSSCDMSAKRIQRETGVTYKTAWRTLRQIRLSIVNDRPKVLSIRPEHTLDLPPRPGKETASPAAPGAEPRRAESMK